MRKLLLATAAVLGVMGGNAAMAYDDMDQSQAEQGQSTPAPGTITVRLNGRVRVYGGYFDDGDGNRSIYYDQASGKASNAPFNIGSFNATTGLPQSAAAPKVYNKTSNYGIESYVRLYPGFDGVAANGLKYGASVEIRTDNNSGAGGGVYGSPSKQDRQRGALYLRRASGYVGTDALGTVKVGGTDGPSGLFMVGNFENFNDGGWNGDVPGILDQSIAPVWPFLDQGSFYSTNKVIYLSPQFAGFDFGVAYEPSTSSSGDFGGAGCNGYNNQGSYITGNGPGIAGAGCDRLSSTSTGDYSRRRNTVDAGARYRGTFADVGIAAYVNYVGSGKVLDSSPGVGAFGQRARQYDGLNVFAAGGAITYAGFSVGGLYQNGTYNGAAPSLKVEGQGDSTAWLGGASYTLGPAIVGASYFVHNTPGSSGPASAGFASTVGQRRDRGVAAGGTYTVAPGLNLFLSYLWGDVKENGLDLITGETGKNVRVSQTKTSLLTLGTSLTW